MMSKVHTEQFSVKRRDPPEVVPHRSIYVRGRGHRSVCVGARRLILRHKTLTASSREVPHSSALCQNVYTAIKHSEDRGGRGGGGEGTVKSETFRPFLALNDEKQKIQRQKFSYFSCIIKKSLQQKFQNALNNMLNWTDTPL